MKAVTNKPYLTQPEKQNSKIWRYMDFPKFVNLLAEQALYFCRSDCLGDPFEGTFSEANFKRIQTINNRDVVQLDMLSYEQEVFHFFLKQSEVRKRTYINCWHMNDNESDAMWKIYSVSKQAIAVQSTYELLRDHLPGCCEIGIVEYIDYSKKFIPTLSPLFPFFRKRLSFEHEKEIRALTHFIEERHSPKLGLYIKIDIHKIIENVFIAPTMPEYYFNSVKDLMSKYDLQIEPKKSRLDDRPLLYA